MVSGQDVARPSARLHLAALTITGVLVASSAPLYNETEAVLYYNYALVSFCLRPNIEAWHPNQPFKSTAGGVRRPKFIGPGLSFRVQGYAAQIGEDHRCVLAFRGTQNGNFANFNADAWGMDSKWPPARDEVGTPDSADWCPGCRAHNGFLRAYEELRGDVMNAIRELNCSSVAVTGHSLGAAVASLASMDLRGPAIVHVDTVYTFGKPRVGNAAFVRAYAAAAHRQGVTPPMWRVVHHHDLIVRANLHSFPWAPRHEGLEVYYTDRFTWRNRHVPGAHWLCPAAVHDVAQENRTCSFATPPWQWRYSDHMHYMGVNFSRTWGKKCGFANGNDGIAIAVVTLDWFFGSVAILALCCWCCCGHSAARCCSKPICSCGWRNCYRKTKVVSQDSVLEKPLAGLAA